MSQSDTPVFIAGTNGSGTRVYANLFELAGVFQGKKKNDAFEPKNIIQYTKPLVPKLIKFTGSATYVVNSLPDELRETMESWILKFAQEVKATCPPESTFWGWKHPRNLFLAPLLHQVFPACYFIQVIRDGRDMAFASNKGDVTTLYPSLFEATETLRPYQYTQFWSSVNTEVAQWCEQHIGPRFVWSRFEDLCSHPEAEIKRIADAIGLNINNLSRNQYSSYTSTPASIGRWKNASQKLQDKLQQAGAKGLHQFGYKVYSEL